VLFLSFFKNIPHIKKTMEVEKTKENETSHLEISPKATIQEPTFEGLTSEECRELEKRRE
jgi:hypothetical protein